MNSPGTVTPAPLERLEAPFPVAAPAAGSLIGRYEAVRQFTEEICAPLEIEDLVCQSMPEASPAKWHLAHTSWFFETFLLKEHALYYQSAVPAYAYLFNSCDHAAGPVLGRAKRGLISRPTVAQTMEYRHTIDQKLTELLTTADEEQLSLLEPLVVLGINHEQRHQELMLADLKHLLAQNPLHPIYQNRPIVKSTDPRQARWQAYDGGLVEIGHDGSGFAYDNEGPRHREFLEPFLLSDRLVTNAEYLDFIEDQGYQRPELWLSLGWQTVRAEGWTRPIYWLPERDGWWHFTLQGARRIDPHEPVCHLSYFEAEAYARWAGARLPTEAEWESAAAASGPAEENFVESRLYHPRQADPDSGPRQLFGDVWEWTASAYLPYPGYRTPPGAPDEGTGKLMCNQMVLRGGSCATSRSHIRASYRKFCPPEKRWQFAGLRLAHQTP